MKNVWVLASLLVACSLAATGQGYDVMPADACIVPIGVAGTGYETMEAGVRGGTLHVSGYTNPTGWNDYAMSTVATTTTCYTNRMHRGMLSLDPISGAIVPDFAKSYEISDDGLVLTFYLRRGIKWSDGVEITADDVLFTYKDIPGDRSPRTKLPDGTYPLCEKVDDHTVRFTLTTIYRPILSTLRFNIMPKHKLAPFVHKLNPGVPAGTFDQTWGLDTPPSELVGNGPYVVTDYQANVSVTMTRNPYYYAYDPTGVQLPYYDTVLTHIGASVSEYRRGEIDVYGLVPEDIPILTAEAAEKGFTVLITDKATYGTTWICPNQDIGLADGTNAEKREIYRNVKFRQALAHLLDKETMIEDVLDGLGTAQWSGVSLPSLFYAGRDYYGGPITEKDAVTFKYDPAKAAELLDEIGVVDQDGDGWRDLPSGTPLVMELNTNDTATRMAYGRLIEEGFLAAGLNCVFRAIEFNALVNELVGGRGDIILLGLAGRDDPNTAWQTYASCGSVHASRFSACQDPDEIDLRIDELMVLGASTFDLDEAFDYYKECQRLHTGQLGFIYLCQPMFLYTYYDYVGNAHLSSPISTPGGSNGLLTELCFDKRLRREDARTGSAGV